MKLNAKTDLDVPPGFVFAALADHASWEAEARQRGTEIERPVEMPLTGVGAGWRIRVQFRGKVRRLLLRLEEVVPGSRMGFSIDGQSIEGGSVVEVLALSERRSRLRLSLEIRPKTLAARLFMNTLRLAKGKVQARFEARVAQFGAQIADRYARSKAQG